MPQVKKAHPPVKPKLHPRNRHRERYDFKLLTESCPALAPYVQLNIYNDASIDFANPEAVKMLNKALLRQYYGIEHWDIPPGYLCPPIPGRADYIHHIADLMCSSNYGKMPTGKKIVCLDIGVGANCVYPIIGTKEYGWSFIGSDIDPVAIESANKIIEANPLLKETVVCRLQPNPKDIFNGIIQKDEIIDLCICNPPFHASAEAAQSGTLRKLNNLSDKKVRQPALNFGGQNNELWCEGGESGFVHDMIRQSRQFDTSCYWFSTLISKQSNLKNVYNALEKSFTTDVKTIPMGQGNKTSRIVAWTFLSKAQQKVWKETRWKMVPLSR
ncbi:MAG TPA: 23S rRNA (adenine(1618)-N(6))-methyltransferase RlmF [Saprospiraceae bacterium]|nr:23S rRNA (adenine(1618)-N(6))-methyltransferase RlmF [Saprospiraceae bacterium]